MIQFFHGELKDGATAGVEKNAQKKDAGSLYTVAKNYGEVYDAICSGSGQEKEADGIAVAEGDSSNSGDAATYIMDDTSDTVDAAVDGVEEIGGTQMIKGAGAQEGQRQIYHQIRQNSGIPGQICRKKAWMRAILSKQMVLIFTR